MHRCLGVLALVLPVAGAVTQARAQDARACVDEVQRLEEQFPLGAQGEQAGEIAGAVGARKGAGLSNHQRRAIGDEIKQARAAGGHQDGRGCMEHLNAARLGLREGGLGGVQPGMATGGDPMGGGTGGGRGTTSGASGQSPDALTGLGAAAGGARTSGGGTAGVGTGSLGGGGGGMSGGGSSGGGTSGGGSSGGSGGGG
jgi:hypothetical protein